MRTSVRVDLARLAANYRSIVASLPPEAEALAVVKANAYGHGAVPVARTLEALGCRHLGVACHEEGRELRRAGVEAEILVMGGFLPGDAEALVEARLTPLLHAEYQVQEWSAAARAAGKKLPCHLKVDTGMSRLGLHPAEACRTATELAASAEVELVGIGTHLASSEDFTDPAADEQMARFEDVLRCLRSRGIAPRWTHFANSAAVALRPLGGAAMVRPGLALYGVQPEPAGAGPESRITVQPALEWTAKVLAVKELPAGARIGYGGTFTASEPMRIALLAVGYGDGFRRELAAGGRVVIGDRSCPVRGAVSMDLTAVDITHAGPVEPGDEATLIGEGLPALEMAARCETTAYEILCGIAARVPRLYSS